MYYFEAFDFVVTTLRKKSACKVGKSCPRLVELAWSQKYSLFQKRWCCVARIIFLFPEPGGNTRSIKVRCFPWQFAMVCGTLAAGVCCVFFTLGQGGISLWSQRGFSAGWCRFRSQVFRSLFRGILLGFVGKSKARFSFCSIHQKLNSV